MSLRIDCPNCGRRNLDEFVYGEIPVTPDHIAGRFERDLDRVFMHDNPAGAVVERWFHVYGCRRWTTVRRDTTNDQLLD